MTCYRLPFKAPMVLALKDGRKRETRRIPNATNANWKVGQVLLVTEAAKLRATGPDWFDIAYMADGAVRQFSYQDVPTSAPYSATRNLGAMFMPAWACRFRLTISSLRKEPLRDITPESVAAEGVAVRPEHYLSDELGHERAFRELWDSINGKRAGCSFYDNPTVLAVRFEVERVG